MQSVSPQPFRRFAVFSFYPINSIGFALPGHKGQSCRVGVLFELEPLRFRTFYTHT